MTVAMPILSQEVVPAAIFVGRRGPLPGWAFSGAKIQKARPGNRRADAPYAIGSIYLLLVATGSTVVIPLV